MSYRGSLRQCVHYISAMYRSTGLKHLAIVKYPRAKYYTIHTPNEIAKLDFDIDTDEHNIIFYGTIKELTTFCTAIPVQASLFDDEKQAQQSTEPDEWE